MVRGRTLAFLDGELFRTVARRPLISVFIAALTPRLALSLFVRFRFDGFLYLDDRSYLEAFRRYAESGGTEKPVIWDSVPSYSRPISLLYRFVLNDPLAALFPSVLAGTLSAVFVAIAVGRLSNARRSLLAGLVVAWWPSQIFWSSLALRDAFIWTAVSTLLASWAVAHSSDKALIHFGTIIYTIITIAYISGSRKHTALAVTLSVVAAILIWRKTLTIFAAFLTAIALVPLALGFGLLGWSLWKEGTTPIAANRTREVAAAETPFSCWDLPVLPAGDSSGSGWRNDILCLPSTFTAFLITPYPKQVAENPTLFAPFIELPLWLALFAFSLRGFLRNRQSHPAIIFAVTYIATTAVMWALIDRAVGTAFRHRGELLAPLVFLACTTVSKIHRTASEPSI